MRRQDQLPFASTPVRHSHAAELAQISRILDANGAMSRLVAQDLVRGLKKPQTGARGLSGDQVLRILVIKQMTGFSYEELSFHLADSVSYRGFCRLGALEPVPSRSAVAENLKKVRAETLEQVLQLLVRYAIRVGVESGQKIRLDATVTATPIHAPTDSSLLFDGVRVLARLLERAQKLCGFGAWSNHTKRAKKRLLEVQHTNRPQEREAAYRDLLAVTETCVSYARAALQSLATTRSKPHKVAKLRAELEDKLVWITAVIDQTERRVLHGQSVPSEEKIVSIFETHTDIIVKDRRETHYGHKIYLAAGESGIITDCMIASGNPADSTMAIPLLERQKKILRRTPEQVAFDGGFASHSNLTEAKNLGITDVAFSKKRGLAISDMARSSSIYRRLRDFRAGIEGVISFLKRVFGLDRCTWRGSESFASYVLSSVIAANLLTLARHLLA
jgi:transposase, IS5 family